MESIRKDNFQLYESLKIIIHLVPDPLPPERRKIYEEPWNEETAWNRLDHELKSVWFVKEDRDLLNLLQSDKRGKKDELTRLSHLRERILEWSITYPVLFWAIININPHRKDEIEIIKGNIDNVPILFKEAPYYICDFNSVNLLTNLYKNNIPTVKFSLQYYVINNYRGMIYWILSTIDTQTLNRRAIIMEWLPYALSKSDDYILAPFIEHNMLDISTIINQLAFTNQYIFSFHQRGESGYRFSNFLQYCLTKFLLNNPNNNFDDFCDVFFISDSYILNKVYKPRSDQKEVYLDMYDSTVDIDYSSWSENLYDSRVVEKLVHTYISLRNTSDNIVSTYITYRNYKFINEGWRNTWLLILPYFKIKDSELIYMIMQKAYKANLINIYTQYLNKYIEIFPNIIPSLKRYDIAILKGVSDTDLARIYLPTQRDVDRIPLESAEYILSRVRIPLSFDAGIEAILKSIVLIKNIKVVADIINTYRMNEINLSNKYIKLAVKLYSDEDILILISLLSEKVKNALFGIDFNEDSELIYSRLPLPNVDFSPYFVFRWLDHNRDIKFIPFNNEVIHKVIDSRLVYDNVHVIISICVKLELKLDSFYKDEKLSRLLLNSTAQDIIDFINYDILYNYTPLLELLLLKNRLLLFLDPISIINDLLIAGARPDIKDGYLIRKFVENVSFPMMIFVPIVKLLLTPRTRSALPTSFLNYIDFLIENSINPPYDKIKV